MPIDWSTLSIMATVAGFGFGGAMWLNGKFDDVKTSFRDLMAEHEKSDNSRFEALGLRMLKVELELDKEGRHVAPPPRSPYEIGGA